MKITISRVPFGKKKKIKEKTKKTLNYGQISSSTPYSLWGSYYPWACLKQYFQPLSAEVAKRVYFTLFESVRSTKKVKTF